MTLKLCSIAAALALALGTSAVQGQQSPAAPRADRPAAERPASDRKVRDAEEDRIEADYKAAKAKCDTMQGNAKDVCQKEAKGKEKVAKAELAAQKDPSPRNQRRLADAKADAEYDVAKEKCDDMKGNEKNACQKEAKAKHEQAETDIKKQFARGKDSPSSRSAASGATGSK